MKVQSHHHAPVDWLLWHNNVCPIRILQYPRKSFRCLASFSAPHFPIMDPTYMYSHNWRRGQTSSCMAVRVKTTQTNENESSAISAGFRKNEPVMYYGCNTLCSTHGQDISSTYRFHLCYIMWYREPSRMIIFRWDLVHISAKRF